MVEIQALSKRYEVDDGEIVALASISISIAESEFVCLLGPSGCGKSTLLRIVAGLIAPSGGSIHIDGRAVTGPGPDRAVVFQDYALFPWMTVAENVEFGLAARSVDSARRRAVSSELLRAVDLGEFAGQYPHHLSGGMKQRVSIARALAVDPVLLLMDEPFGALDAQTRYVMQQELLRVWKTYRKTVLFVTHSIDEALYLADRVLVMTARPGRIKEEIRVSLPRPRDIAGTEFSALRKRALELLSDETARSLAQESAGWPS
jgi:ABC-type nitrate/sulfonate/bicarbonate transport system ATPase subunit